MKTRISVLILALLMGSSSAYAQGSTTLRSIQEHGTVDATTDSVILRTDNIGGFGSIMIQTLDSYTGTWEVQCAVDEALTWDTDNELGLTLLDVPGTVVYSVSDVVGIYNVLNASGCRAIRITPTAGFSGTDTTFWVRATQSGGSGGSAGGGGGGSFDGVLLDAPGGDPVTDTTNDSINVSIVSGGGTGGTSSDFAAAFPVPGTAVGFNDGTNMQAARIVDCDTGAGAIYCLPVNLVSRASGSITELGVSGNALFVQASNLDIQSGGADLVTAAQATTIAGHLDGVETLLTSLETINSNALTAVQLIDDAIFVDDADFTDNTSKGVLGFGLYQSVPQTITDGDVGPILLDTNGRVQISDGGGTITVDGLVTANVSTLPGVDTTGGTAPTEAFLLGALIGSNIEELTATTEGSINALHMVIVDPATNAAAVLSGPCTPFFTGLSTAAVMEYQIKATSGYLDAFAVFSKDATPVYVKVYNDTAANTDETDTPLFYWAATDSTAAGLGGAVIPIPAGMAFSTAMTLRITTGIALNDTGALTANEVWATGCFR